MIGASQFPHTFLGVPVHSKENFFASSNSTQLSILYLTNFRSDLKIVQTGEATSFQETKRRIQETLNRLTLRITKLYDLSVCLIVSSHALFCNNDDFTMYLGHIFFLCDNYDKAVSISFKSYKERIVTHYSMSGEVIYFSHLLDVSITLS